MISIKEADRIIRENIGTFPSVKMELAKAGRCILQENIKADRDLPPFNKALMDGIAVKTAAYKAGVRTFNIVGVQSAGTDALTIKKDDQCTEIMTGAVMTKGADCVIPVEEIEISGDTAKVKDGLKLKRHLHVRLKGSDREQGDLLIRAGTPMGPAQLGVAAAVGKSSVKVSYRPKVAVISSGDELVDIDQEVEPFQIRRSNSYFMQAALDKAGLFETSAFHFKDNKKVLLRQISAIMEQFDVLVLTGGISMGKFDFIPEVMRVLKVDILFQKVKQRPGKPFWFGRTKHSQPIFALPGNPLSTQIGLYRHVIPGLTNALGLAQKKKEYARLNTAYIKDTPFSVLLLVKITCSKEGVLLAEPVHSGGSGDFAASAQADGFIELPATPQSFKQGGSFRLYRF